MILTLILLIPLNNMQQAALPPPPSLLKSSNVYFGFALLILGVTIAYGLFQFRVLNAEQLAITDNEQRNTRIVSSTEKLQGDFKNLADSHSKKLQDFSKKLEDILPLDENYTDLTRLFDNFFAENDTQASPIFQSTLRFGKGAVSATNPSLSVLPVTMNIDSSRENFMKFLEFVNASGSLENGRRLMEINSVQLNFPEGGEVLKDPKQKINFTVDMNVYYQTPKVAR